MNDKFNEKGYALTWVLVTIIIVSILVFSIQSMVLGYHKRGYQNMDEKQAFFTARSVCESISYAMENSLNSSDNINKDFHQDLINMSDNEGEIILNTSQFQGDLEKDRVMGEILSAKIIRHKNETEGPTKIYNYTIEVKARKNDMDRVLTKSMQRRETPVIDVGIDGFRASDIYFSSGIDLLLKNTNLKLINSIISKNQKVNINSENGNIFLGKNFVKNQYIDKVSIQSNKNSIESDFGKNSVNMNFSNGQGHSYINLNGKVYNSKNSNVPLNQKEFQEKTPNWTLYDNSDLNILPISTPLIGGKYYMISDFFDIKRYDIDSTATNPVFLVLTGDCIINSMDNNEEGQPIIYIIIPAGKQLFLEGSHQNYNNFYSVIYGQDGSKLFFEENCKFIGHIRSDEVYFWNQAQNEGTIIMAPGINIESNKSINEKPLNGWVNGLYK